MSSIIHQLNLQGTVFELPELNLLYSPYFKALLQSGLAVDRNAEGQILLELEPSHFQQYANFLLGQDFSLTEEVAALFDYLGHSNDLDYPLDYWAVKLHDNWVRDHFYSLKLYQDPLYDLVPLTTKVNSKLPVSVPAGWYGAGGAALWLLARERPDLFPTAESDMPDVVQFPSADESNFVLKPLPGTGSEKTEKPLSVHPAVRRLADIDLFTCLSKEEAQKSLTFLQRDREQVIKERPDLSQAFHQRFGCYYDKVDISTNSITYYQAMTKVLPMERYIYTKRSDVIQKVQHILRLYRSPSETVHGFDLDCVGVVYLPPGYQLPDRVSEGELWATKRAFFSLQRKVNWFDPDRASPSYVYRLLKYRYRGFQLELPLISQEETKPEEVIKYFQIIGGHHRNNYEYPIEVYDYDKLMTTVIDQASNEAGQVVKSADELKVNLRLAISHDTAYRQFTYLDSNFDGIINDPASLLILARFYKFYSVRSTKKVSDYSESLDFQTWLKQKGLGPLDYNEEKELRRQYHQDRWPNKKEFKLNLAKLNWREQEPMSQLTNTFQPEPIIDLKEWYGQSPFYRKTE